MTPDRTNGQDVEVRNSAGRADAPCGHWLSRPCRFRLVDRVMIVACLLSSLSVSWTLAQEGKVSAPSSVTPSLDAQSSDTTQSSDTETTTAAEEPKDAAAGDDSTVAESVTRVLRAEDRPEWIDSPPASDPHLERVLVSSDPKVSREAALKSLDAKIRATLQQRIDQMVGVSYAHVYLPFDVEQVKSRLIRDGQQHRHDEIVQYSVGTMHEAHALLTIDDAYRQEIHAQWNDVVASMRLFRTGGVAIGVLALIFIVFSYLRLDTVTRGYYSGRLRMLGGLAILGIVVFAVYFFRYNLEWLRVMLYA